MIPRPICAVLAFADGLGSFLGRTVAGVVSVEDSGESSLSHSVLRMTVLSFGLDVLGTLFSLSLSLYLG